MTERRGPILLVTLNRPQARNAIDRQVAEALAAALATLDADERLAAAVLTGAAPGFCAGMDLKAFAADEEARADGRPLGGVVPRPTAKPTIAAVEGFAVAGGLELALTCDLIVAARGARLGLPEVKRSLVAVGGGLLQLPLRVPAGIAKEIALTGEPIDAERAHAVGLVNRLAEPGEAVAVALELAGAIVANGPLAVRATKRILDERAGWSAEETWERQQEIGGPVLASDDAREGALAFAERRDPVWTGR
nr:crotonase/enoyl-CoA hydratase family protein [Conexibacter arvalis]